MIVCNKNLFQYCWMKKKIHSIHLFIQMELITYDRPTPKRTATLALFNRGIELNSFRSHTHRQLDFSFLFFFLHCKSTLSVASSRIIAPFNTHFQPHSLYCCAFRSLRDCLPSIEYWNIENWRHTMTATRKINNWRRCTTCPKRRWRWKCTENFRNRFSVSFIQNALSVNWQQWIALRTNFVRAKKVLLILNCFHLITAHCTHSHIIFIIEHTERAACERACDENTCSHHASAHKYTTKNTVYIEWNV